MRWADIEVPNRAADVNSQARSACYPQSTFYPMSDGPSIRDHRITKACFRTCSTCRSHSQATFCLCTLRLVSNQPEVTFVRLRYIFGGDRPSQTAHQAVSPLQCGSQVRTPDRSGWYFKDGSAEPRSPASTPPTYPTQNDPKLTAKLQ